MIGLSRKGFTLIELMLAVAFLAFVLTSLLLLFINCIFLNATSRNLTIAASHAQAVMEEIKAEDFDNITSGFTNMSWCGSAINQTFNGLVPLAGECINTSWGSSPTNTSLDIIISVSWQDRVARSRSTSLETLITKP